MRRVLVGLLLLLSACGKTTVEHASIPESTTSTTVPYDGRLHVTFTTNAGGDVGGSVGAWKVEPAPAETQPRLTLDEARAKARAMGFRDEDGAHVYFGLFTGMEFIGNDAQGRVATQQVTAIPAWLAFARGVDVPLYGSHTHATVDRSTTYGALAFRDDPSATSGISGSISASGPPVVY